MVQRVHYSPQAIDHLADAATMSAGLPIRHALLSEDPVAVRR
jgi:hypothetical protein